MTQKDWPVFVISVPYYLAWIDETAVNIMNIKYWATKQECLLIKSIWTLILADI